ncbi:S-methyl-5'-thioadenosine phosphorylase [Aliidiomarina minuta]|uniref:Purine nucleoside phosphorylase n=1 Tax=Aliidiomarina minuta TaxID=880057 RepID=A0A432W5X3_9GAMM|nr:S-methyl-5'-thioadenosine phosphorylase [Aliidiomarina minuta]RUO25473.1 S-methyl-5'-thioadenosine phosphorylase [Aliidiomarina minuta]
MLAVIGGSGLYQLDGLETEQEHQLETPFGATSAPIIQGRYQGQSILFLARHGAGHKFLPHEVNYRANIFALKKLGATRIFAVSAAGSLREELKPGDLALVSQYFDHTRGKRAYSFFGDGIAAHVSTAHPACPALQHDIEAAAKRIQQPLHANKTYACVEGPRLGTQAESFFLRDAANCDLVGMTNVPEAFLAREAQLAYCTLCLVTDYDCWMEDPAMHVSVEKFFEVYGGAVNEAKAVLTELVNHPFSETPDNIKQALSNAVLTADDSLSTAQKAWLDILRA